MTMTTFTAAVAIGISASALAPLAAGQRGAAPAQGVRDVMVTAIPAVIAAGATWTLAWQGTDNADGIVGTNDGGLLFAQEQPNQISRLDRSDRASVFLRDTHGAGALSVDAARPHLRGRTHLHGSGARRGGRTVQRADGGRHSRAGEKDAR